MLNDTLHHCPPDWWLPSSSDCNPLNYFFCAVIEAKTKREAHHTVYSLKAAIVKEVATVDKNMVVRPCDSFAPPFRWSSALSVVS